MNKKNILIVTQAFFPENSPRSFRATELAKEFARSGHTVTVITPKNEVHHIDFSEKYNIKIKDMGRYSWRQLAIKGKRFEQLLRRVIFRSFNLFFEYPGIQLFSLVKKALKNETGYDLVISIAVPYPVHWGVAAAWKEERPVANIWAADCGDPYMGDKTDSFRKMFYFKFIEKWFCRKAHFITVPTLGSIDAYYPEFRKKIKVIPQGFNFEETRIIDVHVSNEVPTFAYAGGFIPGIRDPKMLLEYLNKYQQPFKFIIYTNNEDIILPYVAGSNGRIQVRPYIPREKLLFELSKMDFLININNGTNVQTPSKLIDYALTKRPILSIESGIDNTEIISEFLNGNYSRQLKVDDLEKYNIKNVAGGFLALCKS